MTTKIKCEFLEDEEMTTQQAVVELGCEQIVHGVTFEDLVMPNALGRAAARRSDGVRIKGVSGGILPVYLREGTLEFLGGDGRSTFSVEHSP